MGRKLRRAIHSVLDQYSDNHGTFMPVRLGDILIEQGLVSRNQMITVLGRMKREPHSMLGQIQVEMGFMSRRKLTQANGLEGIVMRLLAEVNTAENKIWTAEDPIEITHSGLRQIQMLPRTGLTFAVAMRAFLRADPDIIMVGEMRDKETSHIAIKASLTGHLVLSTLHTNSAPESVVRLLDMGLNPFSFSDALVGVLGQRLARRLCMHCKSPVADVPADLAAMADEYCMGTDLQATKVLAEWQQRYGRPDGGPPVLHTAKGCDKCNHTGHKGRVGLYELMRATPAIKTLVQSRAPVEQLLRCAAQEGMLTLMQYGIIKMLEGKTDSVSVRSACT